MLVGCLAVLMASAGFLTELPADLQTWLFPTNEVKGVFTQTKTFPDGRALTSRGSYHLRPGTDFAWRMEEPFDSLFWSDQQTYCYSNEDEVVSKPLRALPGWGRLAALMNGNPSDILRVFDVLYKEENGVQHLLAKPKDARLQRFLSRVEADGTPDQWQLTLQFADQTGFRIKFINSPY